ncbi:DNA recombination protein RmuC [Candidatus Ruminimicrobiellum ovillum]|uniref:DNA recombination protein RmuC n=1 Tax=Candidatus Ruminimicrobiellum ovillum TaxID=1947927 RepID=UPI00355A00F8
MLTALIILVSINLILILLVLLKNKNSNQDVINKKFDDYEKKLDSYEKGFKDEFERSRRESTENERASRKENQDTLMNFQNSINAKFDTLSKNTQESLDKQKETVQTSLKNIQDSNEKKLEQMRLTVDEKLQSTLEKRLNSSFELVSKQLESVQKGLGEMQSIANDVGGLKRALTSVKVAGTMGEVQLEALLSQILTASQYEKNAHPNPSNPSGVVEFAVKLPSKESEEKFIYLPIDSKFPTTAYEKLLQDYELADKNAIESDKKKLVTDIRNFAKDIKDKYISVPYTTDFAVMFLPFEGLYLEILRIPGLIQQIQNDFSITISGPTTLGAFLNSLQMGFRTLAIQEQTDNVWNILRAVRTEFGKFGDVLDATKRKLESASKEIDNAGVRTRAIERKLRDVESLPEQQAEKLLENI